MMNLQNQTRQTATVLGSDYVDHTSSQFGRLPIYLLGLLLVLVAIAFMPHTAQAAEPDAATSGNGERSIQIVGGQPADPGEWSWQVYVRSGPYMCGGTLI